MDYKDRQTGLVLFGILWILVGLAQGGMALLMVVGSLAASVGAPGAGAVLSSDAPKGPAVKRVRKAAAPGGEAKGE